MDLLEAIKAELARVREEQIGMEPRLIAVESALGKYKRVISDCKAKAKLADDLVNVVIEAVVDNDQNIDEETMNLIEEATRDLTEALNDAQSRGSRPADNLVNVVIEAVVDNYQNIDEETMDLTEEATRDLTEALNDAQCRGSHPADGGNGGHEGSSGDHNLNIN